MNVNFDLDSPMPYLNTVATKGNFFLQYPSGWSYWQIQNEAGQVLKDGNHTFSQEVLATWLETDDVLIDDIKTAAPWIVPAPPVLPEPTPELPEPTPQIEG